MKLNKNYENLNNNYLFVTIKNKVEEFRGKNLDKKILNLGIGDVTLPLSESISKRLSKNSIDMADINRFKGYCDEQGIKELREDIKNYYVKYNIKLDINEIFVSDGACSDLGNILDIFEDNIKVVIPTPVYPAYVDVNIMKGNKIEYIYGNEENKFLPMPNYNIKCDLIYLCSPNNPTGSTYTKKQLEVWIEYALANKAIIIFDSAYQIFIKDKDLPKSIYEIKNSEKCCIEICSFSKTAGFTGLRCGYTIVPKKIDEELVNKMWLRRQSTKFNGASYLIQEGAREIFTEKGLREVNKNIEYYLENARLLKSCLNNINIWNIGGENSPYIWVKCENKMKSWEFFDFLLNKFNIVCTPGIGFGKNADDFCRFSCFAKREDVEEVIKILNDYYNK